MNHTPSTENNDKSADLFNKQFCTAIQKEASKCIIAEWEKLVVYDYVETVHNLTADDEQLTRLPQRLKNTKGKMVPWFFAFYETKLIEMTNDIKCHKP